MAVDGMEVGQACLSRQFPGPRPARLVLRHEKREQRLAPSVEASTSWPASRRASKCRAFASTEYAGPAHATRGSMGQHRGQGGRATPIRRASLVACAAAALLAWALVDCSVAAGVRRRGLTDLDVVTFPSE